MKTHIVIDIPENMEIDNNKGNYINESGILIPLRKIVVKDFAWYVKKFNKEEFVLKKDWDGFLWTHIPFSVKIGILKCICDDLKYTNQQFYEFLYNYSCSDSSHKYSVEEVCPKEFLDSFLL